eukprot:UN07980
MASCTPILQASTFMGVIFNGYSVVGFLPMWQIFPNCQATHNITSQSDFAKAQLHRPDITVGICEVLKSYYNLAKTFEKDAESCMWKIKKCRRIKFKYNKS